MPVRVVLLVFICSGLLASGPAPSLADALTLKEAVQQTLGASLDLSAQRIQLDADREAIGLSRAALLPQIAGGAQGQILDSDRSDGDRGNVTQKSATVSAGASQLIFDDGTWAGYTIQKHLFDSQQSEFEITRLGVIASAASTFLGLEQARAIAEIQRRNREVTRQNIETARARVATGYSGERDVLRWQTQLSANDSAVVQADVGALVSRFELNRVRDRPREDAIEPAHTTIEAYGFAFARPAVAAAVDHEEGARRLRDFMVRVGVARSPVIAAIDAAIEAEDRQVVASRRAFWAPTLTLGAGVNYLAAKQSDGSQTTNTNETEWGVKAGLTIPIFEGGGRVSGLRQSRFTLSSLRTQRRSAHQTIGEAIRATFAQATGSYRDLGFARERVDSSKRNYELVNQSYTAGVSSILDLLDAQTQLLQAEIGAANAYYGFLSDLIAAEQALALFDFLEPEDEVSDLLDTLEASISRVD